MHRAAKKAVSSRPARSGLIADRKGRRVLVQRTGSEPKARAHATRAEANGYGPPRRPASAAITASAISSRGTSEAEFMRLGVSISRLAFDSCLPRREVLSVPSPLAGGGPGERGCPTGTPCAWHPPSPTPSPQGGRGHTSVAATIETRPSMQGPSHADGAFVGGRLKGPQTSRRRRRQRHPPRPRDRLREVAVQYSRSCL